MTKKILILGVSGMLGHALFKHFFNKKEFQVVGTVRTTKNLENYYAQNEIQQIIPNVDAENFDSFFSTFEMVKPDVVINCIGIIKHLPEAKNYYKSINTNALLPHKLAKLCTIANARLIHISTDCVFDGKTGDYKESDNSNAEDLYGKSKYLGEVDYANALTLRTSIIGHELNSNISLIDWFLFQQTSVNGYINAIYTGFPTYEIANIIDKFVLTNPNLHGLYHLSSNPISKYELLDLIKIIYKKNVVINKYEGFILDRSLNSTKFRSETGFTPKSWLQLIEEMYKKFIDYGCYKNKYKELRNLEG